MPRGSSLPERTILLVEDESSLRVALARAIEKMGFSVLTAENGTAAIDLLGLREHTIDLILLDFMLPGASSREVFECARALRPKAKVIIMSASMRETVDSSFEGLTIERFLPKPIHITDLLGVIEDALSS